MRALTVLASLPIGLVLLAHLSAQQVRNGAAAFGARDADAPGVSRHIRPTDLRNYAAGLRNSSGMAVQPGTDTLWCTGNERDHTVPIWRLIS